MKQKSEAFIELQAANNEVVRVMPLSYHMPQDYDLSILPMSEVLLINTKLYSLLEAVHIGIKLNRMNCQKKRHFKYFLI